jgi:peptidoglycan/LPS O-acetylase OafA/YrhL
MESRDRLTYVDGLRALALLSVLAFSAVLPLMVALPARLTYLASGIDLFFAISGFCLAYPWLSRVRAGSGLGLDPATYRAFLLRRFSRVAPAFYVALAVFALLGMTAFGFPTATGIVNGFSSQAIHEFFLDLVFLIPNHPVHDSSFWAVGVAARWYLVCPLLIALYVRSRWSFGIVMGALYGAYYFLAHGFVDLGTLPCFMAGVVSADVAILRPAWSRYAWLGAAAAVGCGIWNAGITIDYGNPVWHAAAFFIVVTAGSPVARRLLGFKPLVAFGVASYSIYLYAAPFTAWFEMQGAFPALAAGWATCLGFVAWAIVELRVSSDPFRRGFEARLSGVFPRPRHAEPSATQAEAA